MANPHLEQLLATLTARYSVDRAEMTYADWIETNTSLRKRPFSFEGYEFQVAITNDLHPSMAVKKCSQVGLTEVQIRKAMAFLRRTTATSLIFSLPNEDMFKRVSKTRIRPLVKSEKVFNLEGDDESPVRSMELIQIGSSFMYITGCGEKDATSIPADFLMHDELDLSPMNMIGLFQSRLQNSLWKITQEFSTPTFTGYGIDQKYEISDKREFMVRCVSCNRHQVPTFTRKHVHIEGLGDLEDLSHIDRELAEELDLVNAYVKCEYCEARLDLSNPNLREWVAEYPSRTLQRGYWVRPFSTSRLTIEYIVRQLLKFKDQDYIKGWYNTVLGEAYIDAKSRLGEDEIRAVMRGEAEPQISADTPVAIGIDIGQTCHIVLGALNGYEGVRVFKFETCHVNDLLERVFQILQTYRVIAGTVDRHPYTPEADRLRDLSQGRILPVEYRGTAPIGVVKDEFDTVTHMQANRTKIIDEVVRRIRNKSLEMAGYGSQRRVVIEHLRDMVREEKPEEPAKWVKLSGNDHYFHALAFLTFASKLPLVLTELVSNESRSCIAISGLNMVQPASSLLVFRNGSRSSTNSRIPVFGRL